MKAFNLVLIVTAITLFQFGLSIKELSENVTKMNVETFIRSNTIILPTTIFKTKPFKTFSSAHQLKVIAASSPKSSTVIQMSKSSSITHISSTVTSTSLASLVSTAPSLVTIDCISSDSLCNTTDHFDFIPPPKQTPLEYYRVNDTIQIFEIHCNHNAPALASNENPGLIDFQIIPASNIIACIVSCAVFNHQKPVGYNDWVSLCSTISLVENTCYLKTNTNLSHQPNLISWKNGHTACLRFW